MGSKLALYVTASTGRIAAVALTVATCAGLAKYGLVALLVRWHTNAVYLRLQDTILTGVLVGLGVWAGLMVTHERRKYIMKQVETVAQLNHELRNALEVILGSEYLNKSNKGEIILDSVERINRTLDAILGIEQPRKSLGKQLPLAYRRGKQN